MSTREWRLVTTATKAEVEDIALDHVSSSDFNVNYIVSFGVGVAAITLGLAGAPLLSGISAVISYAGLKFNFIEDHIEYSLKQELAKITNEPDHQRVGFYREFRWSGRQGGHWIPTYNFEVRVLTGDYEIE